MPKTIVRLEKKRARREWAFYWMGRLADNGVRLQGSGYDAVGAFGVQVGGAFFHEKAPPGKIQASLAQTLTNPHYLLVILRARAQQALIAHAAYICT